MALLSVGVTLDGCIIAFPDCVRVHGPPNERIWRAIESGTARMTYLPRKRWPSGHAAESVGSKNYLQRIAEEWADMEPATRDWFEANFHQSWWSQVEEVA